MFWSVVFFSHTFRKNSLLFIELTFQCVSNTIKLISVCSQYYYIILYTSAHFSHLLSAASEHFLSAESLCGCLRISKNSLAHFECLILIAFTNPWMQRLIPEEKCITIPSSVITRVAVGMGICGFSHGYSHMWVLWGFCGFSWGMPNFRDGTNQNA